MLLISGGLLLLWYAGYIEKHRKAWISASLAESPVGASYCGGVSIVIAFRDEQEALPGLMKDLLAQDHPMFEVILINDHSQDTSVQYLTSIQDSRVRILNLEEGFGKKAAVELGISCAHFPVLLFTDADCRMSENWICGMTEPFQQEHIQLVSGPVSFSGPETFWYRWMKLEFASLVAIGAGAIFLGQPGMCNGANLACRKKVWLDTLGRRMDKHIDSGDDMFLLHAVQRNYPAGVSFVKQKSVMVKTPAPATLSGFISQRIRWAGKSKAYQSTVLKWQALGIFCVHTLLFLALIYVCFRRDFFVYAGLMFAIKSWIDYFLFKSILPFFGGKSWKKFLALQELVQIMYVVLIGILAMFGGSTWKGRKVKT